MTKEYSPFTPGIPVPLELFVGRGQEVRKILDSIQKAQALQQVERIFVLGDRGIGKSSICKLAIALAERDFNTLGLHVFLGGVTTLEEMARRIFERLLQESLNKLWYETVKHFLGNHVKQVGLFGITVEFDATPKQLERVVSDFVPALRNLLDRLKDHKKGILLVLDDLNGLASKLEFANWFKSIVDEIATGKEGLPLTIILVGLPERRSQLITNQPSLNRVFDLVNINTFNDEEVIKFYENAFSKVNQATDERALKVMCHYSGGYPVIMHELGDSIFSVNDDELIDFDDAIHGLIRAADNIGKKYLESKVLEAVESEKYHSILYKLSTKKLKYPFDRQEVLSNLTVDEKNVFDNFLNRMVKLNVMQKRADGKTGFYKFTREIFKLYFNLQGETIHKKQK